MGQVFDALCRLGALAEAGAPPDAVVHDAELIAAGWWWNARGDVASDRLVLLVQELRRWCLLTSERWDRLERAGRPEEADQARRRAEALGWASHVLHLEAEGPSA